MKKAKINKLLLMGGLMLTMGATIFSTKTNATTFYQNDVIAPWGKIIILNSAKVDDINYVDKDEISLKLYASDDMCKDEEIKYYISTSEITDTTPLDDSDWKTYDPNATLTVKLPNLTGTNTIYAIFKDLNGNTSLIYSGTQQQIIYDANEGKYAPTGVTTNRKYGAPFIITNQTPEREGYYFLGWSTDKTATAPSYRQGDAIPPDAVLPGGTTATLYAVWTKDATKLYNLSSVVKVGDYVNYPVYYDNIATYNGEYIAKLKGWRVLDIEQDGTLKLISAGVPLTYYFSSNASTTVTELTTNFINTKFNTSGFDPNKTIKEIFTNEYTKLDNSSNPMVRAMTKEDVDKIYDPTGETVLEINNYNPPYLYGSKYQKLLAVPCSDKSQYDYAYYWLASEYGNYVYTVYYDGRLTSDGGGEKGIRPVVSLKPEVLAISTDMSGAWNITIVE